MADFLRRIVRAVIAFCRRGKTAAEPVQREGEDPWPLWVVMPMGDRLVMILSRKRETYMERWLWLWPLNQIERLELRIEQQGKSPEGWLDWEDAQVAKKQARLAAREWRETAEKGS